MEQVTAQYRTQEAQIEKHDNTNRGTCLSVIMPVFNEGQFIEKALRSLQAQRTQGFDLEILVVDGISEDRTQQTVTRLAAEDRRVKLLTNPSRHTPAALNIGLRAASGEYVGIMGAHADYDDDYILVCLRELLAHGAVGCSGKIVTTPANSSPQARLVAWVMGHPFASSSHSVRTQAEGDVDTVPFPVLRRQALLEAGGYDERLMRNQDNDMNQRLRAMGYTLYATHKTTCRYYSRPSIWSFLKYAYMSGRWNAVTLRVNRASLSCRHFIPMLFVSTLLILMTLLLWGFVFSRSNAWMVTLALAFISACHLGLAAGAGIQVGFRERTPLALWLAPLIFAFHCSYGMGTLLGLFSELPVSDLPQARRVLLSSTDAASK